VPAEPRGPDSSLTAADVEAFADRDIFAEPGWPERPQHLGVIEVREWERLGKLLHHEHRLTKSDGPALAIAATAYRQRRAVARSTAAAARGAPGAGRDRRRRRRRHWRAGDSCARGGAGARGHD
jgi:phage terminase small subunit